MDFRYEVTLEDMHLIAEKPSLGDMNIDGALRLKPGAADSSIVYLRMRDLGEFRMPPLASSVIDESGTGIIRRWIDSLVVVLNFKDSGSLFPAHPVDFYLFPVYPNPFNPQTTIKFTLPIKTHIRLNVYTISGKKITTLINSFLEAGNHTVLFDGTSLASGVYLYRLQADAFCTSRKMVLLH